MGEGSQWAMAPPLAECIYVVYDKCLKNVLQVSAFNSHRFF